MACVNAPTLFFSGAPVFYLAVSGKPVARPSGKESRSIAPWLERSDKNLNRVEVLAKTLNGFVDQVILRLPFCVFFVAHGVIQLTRISASFLRGLSSAS